MFWLNLVSTALIFLDNSYAILLQLRVVKQFWCCDNLNMASNNPGNSNAIAGALTYPNRDGESSQLAPVQPRQPRNLQGLLRFAMEATKAEDAPGPSELGPMDEQRRKFLEEALKSLTLDMVQLIQQAINVLADSDKMNSIQLGDTLPDDVKTAFNNLMDYIDDMDVANDFYKMGGFAIFPICYSSENDEVRANASSVLAELCQNNPYCQAKALECGLLNVLLDLLQSERGQALVKCLYAISCSTREYEPAYKELVAQGGCATLAQLLRAPEPNARTKAAFLVTYLCHNCTEAKEQFIRQNLIEIIVDQIRAGRDDSTEHLLSIIASLVEDQDPTVLSQCREPTTDLKNVLENHLRHPDLVSNRFMEEKHYCQEIFSKVFVNCPSPSNVLNEEIADR